MLEGSETWRASPFGRSGPDLIQVFRTAAHSARGIKTGFLWAVGATLGFLARPGK